MDPQTSAPMTPPASESVPTPPAPNPTPEPNVVPPAPVEPGAHVSTPAPAPGTENPAPVTTASDPMAPTPFAPEAKKKFPTWLKVVIGLVIAFILFIVVIFVVVGQATKGASKVSDQFVAALQADKPNDAYKLSSSEFQQATSQSQLSQVFDQNSSVLQGKTAITGRAVSKSSGKSVSVIVYKVDASSGTKYIRITLNLESDGSWKVLNFRSSDTPLDANYLNSNN